MPAYLSRFTLIALSLLLVSTQAAGATKPPSAQAESLYDIEVVIFERFGQGDDEHWPEDPGKPDLSLAQGNLSDPRASGNITLLGKEEQQLGPIAYTLKRKGALVHAHLRWRQDVKDRNSDTWYLIGKKRLKGLLRISKGRFLHLNTDLVLRPPNTTENYRIQLHRRMRSGEVHYLDHPKVGLIVRADRYQLETETPVEIPPKKTVVPSMSAPEPVEPPDAGSTPRALPDPT